MGLEREGVVRVVPHRGAFVEPIDEQTVRDHFELYALVDGFALRKACGRADADELAELADAYELATAMDDPDRLQVAIVRARSILHELGGSPRFRAVARGLAGIVPGNFFAAVEGSMAIARRDLPEVAAALAARDAVRGRRRLCRDDDGAGRSGAGRAGPPRRRRSRPRPPTDRTDRSGDPHDAHLRSPVRTTPAPGVDDDGVIPWIISVDDHVARAPRRVDLPPARPVPRHRTRAS